MSKRKGDIEWVDLEPYGYEGRVGVEHKGPGEVLRWDTRLRANQQKEYVRIAQLRKEIPPEIEPALHKRRDQLDEGEHPYVTPEGITDAMDLALDVCKAFIRKGEGPAFEHCESTPDAVVDEVERLGLTTFLIEPILAAQQVRSQAKFRGADDGGVDGPDAASEDA